MLPNKLEPPAAEGVEPNKPPEGAGADAGWPKSDVLEEGAGVAPNKEGAEEVGAGVEPKSEGVEVEGAPKPVNKLEGPEYRELV